MTIQDLIAGANLSKAQITMLKHNLATIEFNRLQGLQTDVARAEEGSVMTRAGLDILAKGIAGKLIKYTRVALGDSFVNGALVEPTDAQIANLTDLINPLQDIPIIGCQFKNNGTAVIQAFLQNSNFQNGLWVREIGLFAEDPDSHQEVLYSYRNSGVLSGYTPSGQGAVLVNLVLNLVTVVDNAQNITAIIDTSIIYVSQAQLIDHINDPSPHPNLILTGEMIEPFIEEPLGQLNNRVNQVENNVANLFTQLGDPDANLLIFEDFKDFESVDQLKIKVLSAASNSPNVFVESLDGIIAGHYYTLSDGVRTRLFRAQSLISDNGSYCVIFEADANYSFNISKTYLYRSTAIIEDGQASGSSKEFESTFAPDDIWQGIAATAQTITLKTTQANAANFDLSGQASFDENGFFTLA